MSKDLTDPVPLDVERSKPGEKDYTQYPSIYASALVVVGHDPISIIFIPPELVSRPLSCLQQNGCDGVSKGVYDGSL